MSNVQKHVVHLKEAARSPLMRQAWFLGCPPNKVSPCRRRNFLVLICLFKSFGSLHDQMVSWLVGLFFFVFFLPFFFSSVSCTCKHLTFSELCWYFLKVAAMFLGVSAVKWLGAFTSALYKSSFQSYKASTNVSSAVLSFPNEYVLWVRPKI